VGRRAAHYNDTPLTVAFLGLCVVSAYLGVADLEVTHDKILHFLTFFILSTVFYWIVEASRTRCINMTIVVCTVVGGIGSEFLQGFLPVSTYHQKSQSKNLTTVPQL
jgi:VanZ family protein